MMYAEMAQHKNNLKVEVKDEKGKVIRNSKIYNDIHKIGIFFDQINNKRKMMIMIGNTTMIKR